MRIPFIAGNWKMNTTLDEAAKLVGTMLPALDAINGVEKAVCPPFISLALVKDLTKGSSVKLGAQNIYFEEKGAYTGEVSSLMLAGLCEYVIVGHSERRGYFGESDEIVNKKLHAAIKVGLKPILCVGEKLEQNEAGKSREVVTGQVKGGLAGLPYSADLVIAYEPIWAIGTGKAATGAQANETIGVIRSQFAVLYGNENAQKLRILYGGSVTADNIGEFISQNEIDGGLVGGASLKADQFVSIVKQSAGIKTR